MIVTSAIDAAAAGLQHIDECEATRTHMCMFLMLLLLCINGLLNTGLHQCVRI